MLALYLCSAVSRSGVFVLSVRYIAVLILLDILRKIQSFLPDELLLYCVNERVVVLRSRIYGKTR